MTLQVLYSTSIICIFLVVAIVITILAIWIRRSSSVVYGGSNEFPTKNKCDGSVSSSKNLVVDTLNIVHWLAEDDLSFQKRLNGDTKSMEVQKNKKGYEKKMPITDKVAALHEGGGSTIVNISTIVDTIARTSVMLKSRFSGRIVYVTKGCNLVGDRADQLSEVARLKYQAAAVEYGVCIDLVESLPVKTKFTSLQKYNSIDHASLGRDDFYLIMLARQMSCGALTRDSYRDLSSMKQGALPAFHVYSFTPWSSFPKRNFVNPSAAEFARLRRPCTYYPEDLL
jgi:hypothetical protein